MKYKIKFPTLVILTILFFSNSCNSQKADEKDLIIVNKNESIESKMLNHLELRNNAFKENDVKNIYNYTHPSELNGISFEQFEIESNEYIKSTKENNLIVKNFEILNVGKLNQCNSEYQCIINLKTTMVMDKDEFSFVRKIIAISKDGNDWKFINGGENDLNTIKKLFPFICLSE